MRPSNQYQNEAANNCRDLPEKCLIAANEGKPLEAPKVTPNTTITSTSSSSSSTTLSIPQPNNQQITSIKPPQIQIPPKGK